MDLKVLDRSHFKGGNPCLGKGPANDLPSISGTVTINTPTTLTVLAETNNGTKNNNNNNNNNLENMEQQQQQEVNLINKPDRKARHAFFKSLKNIRSTLENYPFVTWNCCRGLDKKIPLLEQLINVSKAKIIALQEVGNVFADIEREEEESSGINNNKSTRPLTEGKLALQQLLKKKKYNFVTATRSTGGTEHGGVAILYKQDITVKEFTWEAAANYSGCDSVSLLVYQTNKLPFIFTSFYIHATLPAQVELVEHLKELRSVFSQFPDDMILAGDLNSQFTNIGGISCPLHKYRGQLLEKLFETQEVRIVSPSGPTTFSKPVRQNNKIELQTTSNGFNNDHFLFGKGLQQRLVSSELYSHPLPSPLLRKINPDTSTKVTSWGSDHLPLYWCSKVATVELPTEANNKFFHISKFNEVTEKQRILYNSIFRKQILHSIKQRNLSMNRFEKALIKADKTLPKTHPSIKMNEIYWKHARGEFKATVDEHGEFCTAELVKQMEESRKQVVAEELINNPNPSSIFETIDKFFGRGDPQIHKPPLDVNGKEVIDKSERVEVFADLYASVSADPSDSKINNKQNSEGMQKLLQQLFSIPKRRTSKSYSNPTDKENFRRLKTNMKWQEISFSEVKSAIKELNSGSCADFLGLKAEHLKLLDDDSIKLVIPFFDRVCRQGIYPEHWRTAYVSPVPKPKKPKNQPKSWRPVSVTAIVSRMTESIILSRILHRWNNHKNGRKGASQFAHRRGVSTTYPLSLVSMLVSDGLKQHSNYEPWDAADPSQKRTTRHDHGMGARTRNNPCQHAHFSMILSVDCSNAFDRALHLPIVHRLAIMGLYHEARWISSFLFNRSIVVREDGTVSVKKHLDRSTPQGCLLSPLLWCIFIDSLIAELEQECLKESPSFDRDAILQEIKTHGCIAFPLIFADDINFIIRGMNPSSIIQKANNLLKIVKNWSVKNEIPMGKLKATWITGSNTANATIEQAVMAAKEQDGIIMEQENNNNNINFDNYSSPGEQDQQQQQQEEEKIRCHDLAMFCGRKIVFDEDLWCYADTQPIRLLGVIFDSKFNFHHHVRHLWQSCNHTLNYLEGMKKEVSAEKLSHLYTSLILSRTLFAIDTYFPFTTVADRNLLQRLHYRGCRIITGLPKTSPENSTMMEAGYMDFRRLAKEFIIKTANKLLHEAYTPAPANNITFGMNLLIRLLRHHRMPTAVIRPQQDQQGNIITKKEELESKETYPRSLQHVQQQTHSETRIWDSRTQLSMRDLISSTIDKVPRRKNAIPHVVAAQEVGVMDQHVTIISSPPGNLRKMELDEMNEQQRKQFKNANRKRFVELTKRVSEPSKAVFIYFDASRSEEKGGSCAGGFAIYRGPKCRKENLIYSSNEVQAGPRACIYSGEANTLEAALEFVRNNTGWVFNHLSPSDPKEIVIISDSQSVLRALEKTIIRKMKTVETSISLLLLDLAKRNITIVLGFVFSHLGIPGNDVADNLAEQAREKVGKKHPAKGYVSYDSIRPVITNIRKRYVEAIVEMETEKESFKFINNPLTEDQLLSINIPRNSLSRQEEIRLFAARIGMIKEFGGILHGHDVDCPLCGEEQVIGRKGKTVTHLFRNCKQAKSLIEETIFNHNLFLEKKFKGLLQPKNFSRVPNKISILWEDPILASKIINNLIESLKNTNKNLAPMGHKYLLKSSRDMEGLKGNQKTGNICTLSPNLGSSGLVQQSASTGENLLKTRGGG